MTRIRGTTYLMLPVGYDADIDGSNVEITAAAVVLNNGLTPRLTPIDVRGLDEQDIEHLRDSARNALFLRAETHFADKLRQISTGMSAQNGDTAAADDFAMEALRSAIACGKQDSTLLASAADSQADHCSDCGAQRWGHGRARRADGTECHDFVETADRRDAARAAPAEDEDRGDPLFDRDPPREQDPGVLEQTMVIERKP